VTQGREARVGWLVTAVVLWVLLALPAAVLLGRAIHRADREELGEPDHLSHGRPTPSDRHEVRSR
jgi:hypothetical protein